MKPTTTPQAAAPTARPEIAIFRNNLFRISEPFITQQAGQLQRYRPYYLGRLRFGEPPPGFDSYAVEDRSLRSRLLRAGWQILSREIQSYVHVLGGRRPALIHAHFGIDAVYALPLARRLGVPLVTTFHGFDATLSTPFLLRSPAWMHYPLRRQELARQGSLFLCASAFLRERVLAMGFPPARTYVHYIGIDARSITMRDPSEEAPIILHVARLVEVKGTRYLIEAFSKIAQSIPDLRLVLIGDGPERRSLETLARLRRIESRIDFLGSQSHIEVMAWMRKAKVLVLPGVQTVSGRVEGLGMVLLEAAATGVPMIGSHLGGIPEVVLHRQTGLLVTPRDVDSLAQAIEEVMGDSALRQRMGMAARLHIERHFDIHRQTERLEDFYDQALRMPSEQTR